MKELLFKQFVPFLTYSMYTVRGNSPDNFFYSQSEKR